MKVVDLRKLWNFVVDKFLIWMRLVPQETDLHSVQYNMSRIKTSYGRIWVCGVVVEEASSEGEVTGLNHGSREASRLYTKKCVTCDLMTGDMWVVGWWGSSLIFCYLFWADFENPHCWRAPMSPASTVVSLLAGGHPPAKIAISLSTRLLAGVAPTSTKVF
jgi:hypothetical protein